MVFSNGCRAPPWRQVLGDICYIQVLPFETDPFCITASTEGYYINKVPKPLAASFEHFCPVCKASRDCAYMHIYAHVQQMIQYLSLAS